MAREDLIAAKRAAGRPQDLLDVAQFTGVEDKPAKRRSSQQTRRKAKWTEAGLQLNTSPPNQQAFYEQAWSLVRQAPRGGC